MMIDIKLNVDQLDDIVRAWMKETLKSVQYNAAAHYVHPQDAETYKKDIEALKWLLEYTGDSE